MFITNILLLKKHELKLKLMDKDLIITVNYSIKIKGVNRPNEIIKENKKSRKNKI